MLNICTMQRITGIHATMYRIQSRSWPYNTCGFSHLQSKMGGSNQCPKPPTIHTQYLRILEQSLQINFLLAVRTRLLLADDAPAAYAVLMEHMIARQSIASLHHHQRFRFASLLNGPLHIDVIAAHGAHVLLQVSRRNTLRLVVLRHFWVFKMFVLYIVPTPTASPCHITDDHPTHPNRCCHLVRADLGQVTSQHTKVRAVEDQQRSGIHPDGWQMAEQHVDAEKHAQNQRVADDAQHVCHFVDEIEPFVDEPGCDSHRGSIKNKLGVGCVCKAVADVCVSVSLTWAWYR